jgi:hypothetical protein
MATRTNYFIQASLDHMYLNTAITNIGNVGGLLPSTVAGSIFVALMTDSGEADFTSYARMAIPRSSSGFVRASNVVSNVATITFPKCTGGSNTITKIALYDASTGGNKLHEQTLSDPIPVVTNVQAIIEAGFLTITGS